MSEYSIGRGIRAIRLTIRGGSRAGRIKSAEKLLNSNLPHPLVPPLLQKEREIIMKEGLTPLLNTSFFIRTQKYIFILG